MKKKPSATIKDEKDWTNFTKEMGSVRDKDLDHEDRNVNKNKIKKLDLHGFSLDEANKKVKKFITEASKNGYKKLLIVTGKGLRSKVYDNPYLSEKMNVLKYSVPEYIENDLDLSDKISKISQAEIKDGGEGAIYVYLKK